MIPPGSPPWSTGVLERRRAPGKLRELEAVLAAEPLDGHHRHRPHPLGHPRRADRRPTPIRTSAGRVALVHNGIIENFAELKAELKAAGPRLRERDRHRGRRPSARPRTGHRPGAAGRLQGDAGPADRRLCPVRADRGRGRPDPGRPQRAARWSSATATARCSSARTPWRVGPFTNRVTYLEDGDYVAIDPRRRAHLRRSPARRSTAPSQDRLRLRRPGGEGQLPALHGEGDP